MLKRKKERKIMVKSTKVKNVESVEKALTIKDRFALIGILPKQNDIITMVMIRDIEIRMTMTQDEKNKHKFRKSENGGWEWELPKKRRTFTFSNAEMELIRTQITELDKQKKISADLLDFCILMRE